MTTPHGSRTIIIGARSNLTAALVQQFPDAVVVASQDIGSLARHLMPEAPADIIYNTFVKSTRLRELTNPHDYSRYALGYLSEFVTQCRAHADAVRSVLYTSSSSVYGDNSLASEHDHCEIRGLYPAMKLASEFFVRDHLCDTRIRVVIPRVFNMFGGDDAFSIVAKIAACLQKNEPLTIANEGEAIRDFIAIEDVVASYQVLLASDYQGVINIGTGRGMSVRRVIEAAERAFGRKLQTMDKANNEIRVSIANIDKLATLMQGRKFRTVEDYYLALAKAP